MGPVKVLPFPLFFFRWTWDGMGYYSRPKKKPTLFWLRFVSVLGNNIKTKKKKRKGLSTKKQETGGLPVVGSYHRRQEAKERAAGFRASASECSSVFLLLSLLPSLSTLSPCLCCQTLLLPWLRAPLFALGGVVVKRRACTGASRPSLNSLSGWMSPK